MCVCVVCVCGGGGLGGLPACNTHTHALFLQYNRAYIPVS